jgi:alkanesulfonate monooxygenase SsuD/methylene tetrahydromethanopterin reductase-like flavin-dependent oxidoreductase (luciferase family)
MPKIELGSIGAVLSPGDNAFVDTAVQLEELGYQTIWLTGGPLQSLSQIADVVRATKRARVASAIISVDRFGADQVSALYADLEAAHPGRFVVGLGGAQAASLAPWRQLADRLIVA